MDCKRQGLERILTRAMREIKILRPDAAIGAAVRKLGDQAWHQEADGGPCLVVGYKMVSESGPEEGFERLGWGVSDIYYEDDAAEICNWKPTIDEPLCDAGLIEEVSGGGRLHDGGGEA